MKRALPCLLAMALFLCCSDGDNPFANPSNVGMRIMWDATSFADPGVNGVATFRIFSAETLTIAATVPEHIVRVTVQATGNRLWTEDTIHSPSSAPYRFVMSFSDTGRQTVTISVARDNGDIAVQRIAARVDNPLVQSPIVANFGDTVRLVSRPVSDNVVYHWQFGEGGQTVQDVNCSTFAVITNANTLTPTGTHWVSDGPDVSPKAVFTYTFTDTAGPVLRVVNDTSSYDTVVTADTTFFLTVWAAEPGNQPVASVLFNGESPDLAGGNIYTKVLPAMPRYQGSRYLTVVVSAVDNFAFNNETRDTVWLRFDPMAAARRNVILRVTTVAADTFQTRNRSYRISGTIQDYSAGAVDVSAAVNGVRAGLAPFASGSGQWSFTLPLAPGPNTVVVAALDSLRDTLANDALRIIYDPAAIDTVPPNIVQVTVNGASGSKVYTPEPAAQVVVVAFDQVSGIDSLTINGSVVAPDPTGQRFETTVAPLVHDPAGIRIRAVAVDNEGLRTTREVTVFRNSLPKLARGLSLPYLLAAGRSYRDTVAGSDPDNDPVIVLVKRKPGYVTVTPGGAVLLAPLAQHVDNSADTVAVQFTDGIGYSEVYQWPFVVVDTTRLVPSVRIRRDLAWPSFLQADRDSLSLRLRLEPGTGRPPVRYSARIVGSHAVLLDDAADSVLKWKPTVNDLGRQTIIVTVQDAYRFRDTVYRAIEIVRKNQDPVKLSLLLPDSAPRLGNALDMRMGRDMVPVRFLINDSDHPLVERHTVTVTFGGGSSSFVADSQVVVVNVKPRSDRVRDTIRVIVSDLGGSRDTLQQPVVYLITAPGEFAGLSRWYEENGFMPIGPGTQGVVSAWRNSAGNVAVDSLVPYQWPSVTRTASGLGGHDAVQLVGANTLVNMPAGGGNWATSAYTVFFVALHWGSTGFVRFKTLLSSAELDTAGLALGVDSTGYVGVLTRDSDKTGRIAVSKLRAVKGWQVFAFRSSTGATGTGMPLDVWVGGEAASLAVQAVRTGRNLSIGGLNRNTLSEFPWNGQIAEIAVYERALSDAEVDAVQRYLAHKFGLSPGDQGN